MISARVKGLWGDAIQWAAYTKNRIPHKTLRKTPVEALFNKIVDRSNLRPFGQQVMVHIYKDQRKDRMTARAIPAIIIGYTKTHGTYQVISNSGKRTIAKNPKPINEEKNDEETEEDTIVWPQKELQDLEDIANGKPGRNYNIHCPEKEGCLEGSHVEKQEPQTPKQITNSPKFDSPSQQLFREQNKSPLPAPSKPKALEPLRRSERMGRDLTNWQDRINQGLAGGVNRVGHDNDHPTDEQTRTCPESHEWAKARQ